MYQDFLSKLTTQAQICYLESVVMDKPNLNMDVYFVWNTAKKSNIRTLDKDIESKWYFVIDFDIREKHHKRTWEVMSDDVLFSCVDYIKETLVWCNMSDWRYFVFSGNWFHVYYTGESCNNPEIYKNAVMYAYNKVDIAFDNPDIVCDPVCRSWSRIMRLPWSMNTKRTSKYWLQERKCEIIAEQDKNFDMFFDNIETIAQKRSDKVKKEEEAKQQIMMEKRATRLSLWSWQKTVFDEICDIDIVPIVCAYLWLPLAKDWKNFKSDRDWKNIWCYIWENLLIWTWSNRISWKKKWYNTFSFVKEHYNLSDAETYKRFVDKYSHIATLDQERNKEYKKTLQLQEVQKAQEKLEKPMDHIISFWSLAKRALKEKKERDESILCSYGIDELDKHLIWILPEDLVVIGAETWVGKSEIAFNIAIKNAMKGKKVLLFALEWSMEDIVHRFVWKQIAKKKKVDPKKFVYNWEYMKDEYEDEIRNLPKELDENLIIFDKKTIPNKEFICEMIKKRKDDVDLFVIDHLHYIELTTSDEHRETGEIMKAIKTVNDEIKKPIVVISHMRKSIAKKIKNQRPTENDLHWSSNIAKIASVIILLYRLEMPDFNTWFYVPKNRYIWGNASLYAMYDIEKKDYIWEFANEKDIVKQKKQEEKQKVDNFWF